MEGLYSAPTALIYFSTFINAKQLFESEGEHHTYFHEQINCLILHIKTLNVV